VGGTQSQSAYYWEEENLVVLLEIELRFLDLLRSLVGNFFFLPDRASVRLSCLDPKFKQVRKCTHDIKSPGTFD